ncbi:MAG: hypothetical protein AAF125_05630, partial [Chloroflexota bacterium]
MQKRLVLLVICTLALSALLAVPTAAQGPDTCTTYVADALDATNAACTGLGRNEICYGNFQITPSLRAGAPTFTSQGDVVGVGDVQSLVLAPYTPEESVWGVAVAQIQANLPGTLPGQGVSIIVFGGARLEPTDNNMESFVFQGGVGAPSCADAPNGLLVQTPDGDAQVAFNINGVNVSLGSTAYITADEDDDLLFALLEGEADVTADGATEQITGGEF